MREILAKARELNGLEMDEVAVLIVGERPRAAGRAVRDGARRQGRHLRRAPRALRAALHLQPVQQRLPLLRLPRAQQGAQAPRPHAGRDPPRGGAARRPGPQARPARGRRVVPQGRGFQLRPRQRSRRSTPSSAATARSAASTSTSRRSPSTSSASSRRPASAPTSSSRRPTTARPTHAVHVGGKKRDYDWRVTGMDRAMEAGIDDVGIGVLFGLVRLALRGPRHAAAHPRARARLRRRPAHHQRAAPRAGQSAPTWPATRRSR